MKKIGVLALLLLLVLAGWLWQRSVDHLPAEGDSPAVEEPFAWPAAGDPPAADRSLERSESQSLAARGRAVSPLPGMPQSEPLAVWRALDDQQDLLDLLEQDWMEGRLAADDFANQRAFLAAICEAVLHPDRQTPGLRMDIPLAFVERMARPCQSFTPEVIDQIDAEMMDQFENMEESAYWQRQERLWGLVSQGDLDGARALVFEQLLDGLQSQSMAYAMTAVWELQQHRLVDYPEALSVPGNAHLTMDLIIPTAVALALTCSQIGGCSDNHFLVIALCSWPDRGPCRPPLDLYQAIDQLMTGLEIQYFNHLLDEVERELRERAHVTRP